MAEYTNLNSDDAYRMIMLLRKKYFWHRMSDNVKRYVSSCGICQITKANHTRAPLVQHPLGFMNQRVFMDAKGPLHQTIRGNVYYIVMVCGFTKWVSVFPLPDLKAETIYSAVYRNWITQMGCPVQIHSDRGSSLVGKVAKAFVDLMNIRQTTTVSHHQMANGAAERQIRNTIQLISTILAEEKDLEWDLATSKVAFAINVTPSTTTNQTPFLLKHSSGEEAIIPSDLVLKELPEGRTVDVVVRSLRKNQARIFEKVAEATGNSLRRQKRNYDRLVNGPVIEEGDSVRYENHVVNPTLDKSFQTKFTSDVFKVTKKLSDVNYEIENSSGKKTVAHFNQLKLIPSAGRFGRLKKIHAR